MIKKKGPFKKQVNTMQYDQAFELNSVKEHFEKLEVKSINNLRNNVKILANKLNQTQEISENESLVVKDFSLNYKEQFLNQINELLKSFQNQQFQQFEENEELNSQVITLLTEKDQMVDDVQSCSLKIQLLEQQVGYKFKTKKNEKHR